MAVAVSEIADFLIANLDTIDAQKLRAETAKYIAVLNSLDVEVEVTLAAVPEPRRVLVTNHQVFGYFADRYDFEVIGTVVPVGSTDDGVSGRRLVGLTELLEREGVSVILPTSHRQTNSHKPSPLRLAVFKWSSSIPSRLASRVPRVQPMSTWFVAMRLKSLRPSRTRTTSWTTSSMRLNQHSCNGRSSVA